MCHVVVGKTTVSHNCIAVCSRIHRTYYNDDIYNTNNNSLYRRRPGAFTITSSRGSEIQNDSTGVPCGRTSCATIGFVRLERIRFVSLKIAFTTQHRLLEFERVLKRMTLQTRKT